MRRVLPLRPGKTPHEEIRAARRRLAVRVQNRDDDDREQDMDEQQPETPHLADEPEGDPTGKGGEVRRHLLGTGGRDLLPTDRDPGTDDRDARHPPWRLRDGERRQRFRPVGNPLGVLHDGRDAEVERDQQNQEQRDRHDGNGEGTPATEPCLRVQEERPRRDGDHGRPARRHQKRAHDPEAADDQRGERQKLEGRPGKV